MEKFKVGDKVRVRENLIVGGVYGTNTFVKYMEKYKGRILTISFIGSRGYELEEADYYWTDEMLEEVKEDKMEKTFREVIADIKKGEAWSDGFLKIEKIKDSIAIGSLNGKAFENIVGFVIKPCSRFKLLRKEYTFQEAFKAYEEGKEIESVLTGDRFEKSKRADGSDFDSYWDNGIEIWWKNGGFSLEVIRNKWYIND